MQTLAKKKRFDKIFKNPFKDQIDQFLIEGRPYIEISRWLKEKGEPISRKYIAEYHDEMFNFEEEGKRRYKQKQLLEGAASNYYLELTLIDKYLKEVDKQLDTSALSPGQLSLFMINLMKRKQELLKEDKGINIEINNNHINTNPFKDLKEYEKELKKQIEEC